MIKQMEFYAWKHEVNEYIKKNEAEKGAIRKHDGT